LSIQFSTRREGKRSHWPTNTAEQSQSKGVQREQVSVDGTVQC